MIAEPGQQFHHSVIVRLVLYQLLPEFFLTRSIVRAEVVFAVNIVDDDDPVFVERSIVADVAVRSGESLCGEEHAGVVGQVHHYVGLLGVGKVDTSLREGIKKSKYLLVEKNLYFLDSGPPTGHFSFFPIEKNITYYSRK